MYFSFSIFFFFFPQHSCLGFEYLITAILHVLNTVSAFALVPPEFKFYSAMTPEALLCWNSNFKSLWPLCKFNWKGGRVCCGVWSGVFHHLTNPQTRDSLRLRVIGSSCSFWTWTAAHCSWAEKGPLIITTLTINWFWPKGTTTEKSFCKLLKIFHRPHAGCSLPFVTLDSLVAIKIVVLWLSN